jgi:hypothetical protein
VEPVFKAFDRTINPHMNTPALAYGSVACRVQPTVGHQASSVENNLYIISARKEVGPLAGMGFN